MKIIATFKANDNPTGEKIRIGYKRAKYDGKKGWYVEASNGAKIGYYRPRSKKECIKDINAMYSFWKTFEIL